MKFQITGLLILFALTKLPAQEVSEKSKLTLIGTIHNGNKQFGYKTLFKTLEKINPDIILIEQSGPWKRVFGLQTASFLRIWHPGIEQRALQKYSRKYRNCTILPYDTAIPDRTQYARRLYENTASVFYELDQKANNGLMQKEDSVWYSGFVQKHNEWISFVSDTTLERINKPDIVEMTREVYITNSRGLTTLVNKYITDSTLRNWYLYEESFWIPRNTHMGNQIYNTVKENKGKKIVVLTGLAHVYFLKEYIQRNMNEFVTLHSL